MEAVCFFDLRMGVDWSPARAFPDTCAVEVEVADFSGDFQLTEPKRIRNPVSIVLVEPVHQFVQVGFLVG
jgi:hypothetical protein